MNDNLPSPRRVYLLLWATVGFYLIFWLRDMMRGINRLRGEEVYPVRRIMIGTAILLAFIAVATAACAFLAATAKLSVVFGVLPFIFLVTLFVFTVWQAAILILIADLGHRLGDLEKSAGIDRPMTAPKALGLFCLGFIAVPAFQARFIKLMDNHTETLSTTASSI